MTANELVDTYLAHKGMRRVKGEGYDAILPFFMLDSMYQILSKEISPIPCRQEQKLALKKWKEAYTTFNRDFFRAFNQDQQDEIIDMMDSFESYISNDLMVARVSVMKELARYEIPFEHQKIVSACMLCHVLAQAAQIIWGAIYKNPRNIAKESPYIKAILKHSNTWMNLYFAKISDAHINPNDSEQICLAMDILCKKMVKFLKTL